MLKSKLFEFGKTVDGYRYSDGYWKTISDELGKKAASLWEFVLSDYLYRCCDEEDRKFIDLYFFKKKSVVAVSGIFGLCDRGCQEWREEILKNLSGLAIQTGLIYIDTRRFKKDAVSE